MPDSTLDQQQVFNLVFQALQSCAYNYPVYNYLTQQQNHLRSLLVKESPNPLVKKGQKYYSQNDEDGILLEILSRIGLLDQKDRPSFMEYGVGNGLENNSIILLMLGWIGAWAGNQDLEFKAYDKKKLHYSQGWVSLDNILTIYSSGLSSLDLAEYDVVSMDLDGNDFHFIKAILESGHKPKVFITEYNSKFPPPINFTVAYDPSHVFSGNDYMGASLQTLHDLFAAQGYFLAACNITGSNAFFVHGDYRNRFTDVPQSIHQLFAPPNYGIVTRSGHPPSAQTIASFISP